MGLNLERAPKNTVIWSHWQRLLHWEPLPEKRKKNESEVSCLIPFGKDLVKKS